VIFVKAVLDFATPLIVFTMLTAVGLYLTPADFARVRRSPSVVAVGLLGPLVVLPAIAFALIRWFRPDPFVETGFVLLASCPIGGISNTYSYLARASTALSVTLTALSSLIAIVSIPATTRAFEWVLRRPLGVDAPVAAIGVQLVMLLALPIGLGMVARHRWPQFAETRRTQIQRAGFVLLGLLLALVLASEGPRVAAVFGQVIGIAAVFVAASFAGGWILGEAAGASPPDRFTLAVEFATRNAAIAMAIAVTLMGRTEFAVFATLYFLTELPLLLVAIAVWRWRQVRSGQVD
jgi:bile acid:Na+ symporter, BASS family